MNQEDMEMYNIAEILWRGGTAGALTTWAFKFAQLRNFVNARFHSHWLRNGALRAVLRDSPLGSVASSAMEGQGARVLLTEVWQHYGISGRISRLWHRDDSSRDPCPGRVAEPAPLLSVWLALTDAPNSLEFLHGSHKVIGDCRGLSERNNCKLDPNCIETEFVANLSRLQGKHAAETLSLEAGDVVVFRGLTLHRGLPSERAALCARFVPADYPYMGSMARQMEFHLREYWRYKPRFCESMDSPLFPVVYPRAHSTMNSHKWPVALGLLDLVLNWGERRALGAKSFPGELL